VWEKTPAREAHRAARGGGGFGFGFGDEEVGRRLVLRSEAVDGAAALAGERGERVAALRKRGPPAG